MSAWRLGVSDPGGELIVHTTEPPEGFDREEEEQAAFEIVVGDEATAKREHETVQASDHQNLLAAVGVVAEGKRN